MKIDAGGIFSVGYFTYHVLRTVEYRVRTYIPDKRGIPKLAVRRDMMSTCGKTFLVKHFGIKVSFIHTSLITLKSLKE